MIRLQETSRDYWQRALDAGGFTAIPRWTETPSDGVDSHEETLPDQLTTVLHDLANELGLPLRTLFLAAHAKVLTILTGEQGVVTGYGAIGEKRPYPLHLTTHPTTWRTLLKTTGLVTAELETHTPFDLDDLLLAFDQEEPIFETVFDPTINSQPLDDKWAFWIGIFERDEQLGLQLYYQCDAFDAECATRLIGYHIAALKLMTEDVDATHERQSLLSAEERHFLVEGLAGPRVELPDFRFHELFEQQVEMHPDEIAVVYGDEQWSYRELNGRANQIGQALLARGVGREDVVAVVTHRNLNWMASALAIFKVGGVYLPVEPQFPADRIAAMLSRSECKIALSEPDSTTTLEDALETLPDVQMVMIPGLLEVGYDGRNLNIPVSPNQLAYIYFTSGSTGEPKGAMCEHAGFLNHLFAKIDDLQIETGQVVAQVAPQCFDISLWQLVTALLVKGRTLIIKQDVILDVKHFIDTIVEEEVAVMQVVPSYLEVVLTYLEHHQRALPHLKCVSVTGEALEKELTQRWFAAMPHVKLVNAYGLTETSDDTNHEVMEQPPSRERVPLGPAVNNAYIYIVDEHLAPVPLGAPGEIVFSGVCVGRGYINDPERTRLAFMPDPIRQGERLYRSGDYGRWHPDGKLEFLGRQDAQIKIRGFRIEIGDIENALLRIPGTHRGAVVVTERADQSKHLVAFYSSDRPLEVDEVHEKLSESLPAYMVPSILYWLERLPLTDNGKIDRKTLRKMAAEMESKQSAHHPPETKTEHRLANAWATVLGVPVEQVGRHDHFFDRGGTSLSAVKLAIGMKRAVSLRDITRYPVLAELADLIDGRTQRQTELLQLLSKPEGTQTATLICFPYAGGNAVNFQPMATVLKKKGLAVYAVELPGHDLAAKSERFSPLPTVVDKVVAEVEQLKAKRILLWGHSSGAAMAIETAKRLQGIGIDVARLFIGAQLLGEATERHAAVTALADRTDGDIAASLSGDSGYSALGELDQKRALLIGAAYRHDCVAAHRYFIKALEGASSEKLPVPITAVLAADDPHTTDFDTAYRKWQVIADDVDLHPLDEGGHYFLRTRPAEAAKAVLSHV